jgi:hypothetical protein
MHILVTCQKFRVQHFLSIDRDQIEGLGNLHDMMDPEKEFGPDQIVSKSLLPDIEIDKNQGFSTQHDSIMTL